MQDSNRKNQGPMARAGRNRSVSAGPYGAPGADEALDEEGEVATVYVHQKPAMQRAAGGAAGSALAGGAPGNGAGALSGLEPRVMSLMHEAAVADRSWLRGGTPGGSDRREGGGAGTTDPGAGTTDPGAGKRAAWRPGRRALLYGSAGLMLAAMFLNTFRQGNASAAPEPAPLAAKALGEAGTVKTAASTAAASVAPPSRVANAPAVLAKTLEVAEDLASSEQVRDDNLWRAYSALLEARGACPDESAREQCQAVSSRLDEVKTRLDRRFDQNRLRYQQAMGLGDLKAARATLDEILRILPDPGEQRHIDAVKAMREVDAAMNAPAGFFPSR